MSKISKKDFLATSSSNGTGPEAMLETLKNHYTLLAATYRGKNRGLEADFFAEVAQEIESLEQRRKKK